MRCWYFLYHLRHTIVVRLLLYSIEFHQVLVVDNRSRVFQQYHSCHMQLHHQTQYQQHGNDLYCYQHIELHCQVPQ